MEEDFGSSKIGRIRKYLWDLTEYPETSKAAQVRIYWTVTSYLVISHIWSIFGGEIPRTS